MPGTVARLAADLEWCDDAGVQLAVFPECYLQGYALDRPTLDEVALTLADREFQNLLARAASVRATFVLGFVERTEQLVFNAAAVIRRGAVLGVYRKIHLHRKEYAFEAGTDLPIFDAAGWRFGINICYDANFPDTSAKARHQGARLICYPLNNMLPPDVADRWRGKSVENLRQRAIKTGCWIVSSDVVGGHDSMICHGCTRIVAPSGDLMAQVDEGREGVALLDCG